MIDPLGLCAVKAGWNWFLSHPLSAVADWWDNYAAQTRLILENMVYGNGDLWWLAASIKTAMDVGSGFVDILRFGQGFAEGGWGYAKDVLRGLAIYGAFSQAAKALPGALRSAKSILGNNRGGWSNAPKNKGNAIGRTDDLAKPGALRAGERPLEFRVIRKSNGIVVELLGHP